MGGKKMDGGEEQKRQAARDARDEGKSAVEVGATTGVSRQRTEARGSMSHQERLDRKREGKPDQITEETFTRRPGPGRRHPGPRDVSAPVGTRGLSRNAIGPGASTLPARFTFICLPYYSEPALCNISEPFGIACYTSP